MPEEIKIKKSRSAKPRAATSRAKSSASTIKIKQVKKTVTPLEHVINLNAQAAPGQFQVQKPDRPLYEDPFVENLIADKVSQAPGRWPFRIYRNIAGTFVALSVLVLIAVAYFAFVRLDIAVTPKLTAIQGTSKFKVYDRPADYSVPANSTLGVVRAMDIEWKGSKPVSGKKVSGAELSGTVTIVNNYSKDQPLVASTRLLTPDGQLLRLRQTVNVPAGGQVEAEVYGEATDPSFSLADSRLTIPGLWAGLQDKIYGEAKAGAVKYTETGETFVSDEDIQQLAATAKAALLEKAKTEIDAAYANYSERLYSVDESSLKPEFSAKAGDRASVLEVTMSGTVAITAFNSESVKSFSNSALEAAAPSGGSLVADPVAPASFALMSADTKDNVAEVEMTAAAEATNANPAEIIDRTKLISLRRAQIETYLASLPGIESYELKFTPSFWPVAPFLADRISVHLK